MITRRAALVGGLALAASIRTAQAAPTRWPKNDTVSWYFGQRLVDGKMNTSGYFHVTAKGRRKQELMIGRSPTLYSLGLGPEYPRHAHAIGMRPSFNGRWFRQRHRGVFAVRVPWPRTRKRGGVRLHVRVWHYGEERHPDGSSVRVHYEGRGVPGRWITCRRLTPEPAP